MHALTTGGVGLTRLKVHVGALASWDAVCSYAAF